MSQRLSRREFLSLFGKASLATMAGNSFLGFGMSCSQKAHSVVQAITPSLDDRLHLASGLSYQLLVSEGDKFGPKKELVFGSNNDYVAYIPLSSKEGLLWVNHEYPSIQYRIQAKQNNSLDLMRQTQKVVGGSILHLKKDPTHWRVLKDSLYSRRLDGNTPIPLTQAVAGKTQSYGTFANCAGGVTPWNTVLTCEENYQYMYGDVDSKGRISKIDEGWEKLGKRSPLHYGWVVEVDLKTGKSKKLVSMGRFCHEGAAVTQAVNKQVVAYMGDDANNECIYKFVSGSAQSLEKGTLYVADTKQGKWIPLDRDKSPQLKKHFKTQTEVLVFAREAAKILGGTPQDRPEGIAVHPRDRSVVVALTNNKSKGNMHGSLLRIVEKNNDPLALTFTSKQLILGGDDSGFSCPDNVIFDSQGNLWVTTDMSGSKIGKGVYKSFKNNGLFFIPMSGSQAGKPIQLASAPKDAELTGPYLDEASQTLFVSVQHPGENTKQIGQWTSHWPHGGTQKPASSVVAIQGPVMKYLLTKTII